MVAEVAVTAVLECFATRLLKNHKHNYYNHTNRMAIV